MSSFDAERGVMILEPEQWDVLQRMVTGPVAQRANYAEGVLVGLEDIGVIDPYGPTLAASEVLAGLMAADARYSLRRMDPKDPVPVRDIVFWLSSPRCTVERYDADGVHVYGCDDVEVAHIALANDHLYPRPMVDDGPDDIYDTLAAAVRLADVRAAEANMATIGYGGAAGSPFVGGARDGGGERGVSLCPVRRQSGQTSRWRRRSSASDETGVRADVTMSVPAGVSGQRIGEA